MSVEIEMVKLAKQASVAPRTGKLSNFLVHLRL